jgi:hypothetical protein
VARAMRRLVDRVSDRSLGGLGPRAWRALLACAALAASALLTGCGNRADDCELNGLCASSGDTPARCQGDPGEDNTDEVCAVFADASAAAPGSGTRQKPYASLQQAVSAANGRKVYACGAFDEAVVATDALELYGGFDCSTWTWARSQRAALTAPADAIPLVIEASAERATVTSFTIEARDAASAGTASIALAIGADIAASIANCDVRVGDGADGEEGADESGTGDEGADATAAPDVDCEEGNGSVGGTTYCDDGLSIGGRGGDGSGIGLDAFDGSPGTPPLGEGEGGEGEGALMCGQGDPGAPGTAGADGAGGTDIGEVTASGVRGGDGGAGERGTRGQGGGGGGGARAGITCTGNQKGAGGGGGGGGGCGGKGARGGAQGGASIGIVSVTTSLDLRDVAIGVAAGGGGGRGGKGQAPGGFGLGRDGGTACRGGDGGIGGRGGHGGGGRGGHAIGVAFAGRPTGSLDFGFEAGVAGDGGATAPGGNAGASGTAGACWDFAANQACSD